MRPFARIVSGTAALMTLTLLVAGPATAAGAHRADGWVRVEGYHTDSGNHPFQGTWRGKNIYNTTALHQKATFDASGGTPVGDTYYYFTVNIQNDGAVSDRFKIHGIRPSWATDNSGMKYFHGTTNITSAVRAGTFRTTSLSPGSSYRIQIRLDHGWSTLVSITSVGDPSKSDAVKANVKTGCGC